MNCCRLCGQEEERGRLQCLFEKESLIENVHHFLQIQIFEEDPLSHEICETCEDTVKKIVDFVTECQKMQRQLYKLSNLQRTKADNIVKVKCEPVSFGEPGMKCEFVEDDTLSSSLDNAEYSITASELLFPAGQSSSRNYSSSNVSSSRVPNNSIHYDLQNCDNDNGEILPEFQNLPSSSDENVVLLEENPWKKEEFGYSEQDDNEKTLSTVTPESTLASLPSSSAGNMEDVISTVIEESLSSTKTNDRKELKDGNLAYVEQNKFMIAADEGQKKKDLATRYGIAPSTLSDILTNRCKITSENCKCGIKRNRRGLSLQKKMEILQKYDASKNVKLSALAASLGIPGSTLHTIVKKREKIEEAATKCGSKRQKIRSGKYSDLEEILYEWFQRAREDKFAINGPILRAKAKEIASALSIKDFSISNGWLDRFRKRYGIKYK